MAKASATGNVKTRLSSVLDDDARARLNRAMLADSVARFSNVAWDLQMAVAGEPGPDDLPGDIPWHRQQGADLGERMLHAVAQAVAGGYGAVVLVGSDHPTLPPEFLDLAFEHLASPRSIVIGPSEDGGYYLIGMNALYPSLFNGMRWSHDGVFDETVARALETPAEVSILPPWYDVDQPEDLNRLLDEISMETSAWPALTAFRKDMAE